MSKHLTRKTVNELATAELTQFTLLLDEDLSRITQWGVPAGRPDQLATLQIRLRDRTTIERRAAAAGRERQ